MRWIVCGIIVASSLAGCGRGRSLLERASVASGRGRRRNPADDSGRRGARDSAGPSATGRRPISARSRRQTWTPRGPPGRLSHDRAIRGRLDRGDEDSVVNLWLYGTTFTSRPRATARDIAALANPSQAEALLIDRLDDLVAAMSAPGASERVRFARQVVERRGINLATPDGPDRARQYLVEARARMLTEQKQYRQVFASANLLTDDAARLAAYAAVYRDRGLSSDTSIAVDFAVDQAIAGLRAGQHVAPASVHRLAIVGPGLDFTDKAEGYDFYPLQTIQPFALIDSLKRHGLAASSGVAVTTFDISSRVTQHLERARDRARAGDSYVVQVPLDEDSADRQWLPAMVDFWRRFGDQIGTAVDPIRPPAGAASVRMRALQVPAKLVAAIDPRDLNIVTERLALADADRFDLIVATNVLVYYDGFEQALALANIGAMLAPGGVFLTNYALAPRPPMTPEPVLVTKVYRDRQHNGDTVLAYKKEVSTRTRRRARGHGEELEAQGVFLM